MVSLVQFRFSSGEPELKPNLNPNLKKKSILNQTEPEPNLNPISINLNQTKPNP